MLPWTVEYRQFLMTANFRPDESNGYADFDFNSCENCEHCLLSDVLIRHVICNSNQAYSNSYMNHLNITRCSYKTNEPLKVGITWIKSFGGG
jgi:hypothetical protein